MVAALLLLGQAPILKLSELEIPVTDCPGQVLMGVEFKPLSSLMLMIDSYTRFWTEHNKAPLNYENARVGNTFYKVTAGVYKSKPCKVIEVRGTRNQVFVKRNIEFRYSHKALRQWYVGEDGTLLGEDYKLETSCGTWEMDASFSDDSYTVKLTSPDRGVRTLGPVQISSEMSELRVAPFVPMVGDKGKPISNEKKFLMLDPFTGSPLPYLARATNDFIGDLGGKTIKGQRYLITGGPEKQDCYISTEKVLCRVTLEKFKFLEAER
jgi:hypothetical protein